MKTIKIEHGQGKHIKNVFNTSYVTVRRALRYESKSDLSDKIRAYALKNGGIEMVKKNK
jgi:hypothetical protein